MTGPVYTIENECQDCYKCVRHCHCKAIRIVNGRARTEASGNITLERLPRLRGMGLDFISCGALTHSAPAVDIGLDILN